MLRQESVAAATGPSVNPRVRRSMELYRRAMELIPGGTQLVSRRPTRYANGISPAYAARAKGARFWDVDGNEYIDWVSGIGAIILGYCDPVVDEAVRDQMSRGTVYSINHELEIELAEELVRSVPSAEMVRYAKTGGEACAMAVRIARGVTGRDRVLFCGYHGWHDWYLAANLSDEASLAPHLFPGIDPTGVPKALVGTAVPFPYGDLAALGERLDQHRGEVAAVVMEPLRSETPPVGYLEGVAALCREHEVVLVFDEVTSGFRIAVGGAQAYFGVTPDMTVLGKAISNGYAMAAVVGRRAVMEPAARMFLSSTYWGDTLGLRAALATIRELKRRDVPTYLHRLGKEVTDRVNRAAVDTGLAVRCVGTPVHPVLRFPDASPDEAAVLTTLYVQEMAKRGCHGYAAFYLNAAQGTTELDQTEAAAREVFASLAEHRAASTLAAILECDPTRDAFRRLVR